MLVRIERRRRKSIGFSTVSYTHLDVYKRQHQHDARIAGEEHEAILQLGHDLLDVIFERGKDLVGVANLAAEVGDCLLYTSRCV